MKNLQARTPWLFKPGSTGRASLAAFAGYLLIAIVLTYPLITHFNTDIPGGEPNDSFRYGWEVWWFKHSLLDLRSSPANLQLMNFPVGGMQPLILLRPIVGLISIPLALVLKPPAVYNWHVLFSYPLCGLTAFWLCRRHTTSTAAWLGGLVFAFAPLRTAHLVGGHLAQAQVYLQPLYLLGLLRTLERPSPRRGLLTGLALAAGMLVFQIHATYFFAFVTPLVLGWQLWHQRRDFFSRPRLVALGIMAATAGIIVLPLYWPTLTFLRAGGRTTTQLGGTLSFTIDPLALLLPPPSAPLYNLLPALRPSAEAAHAAPIEGAGYLGWMALALGALAWRYRRAESGLWTLLAAASAIMALGPAAKFAGHLIHVTVGETTSLIPLPYAYLAELPFYRLGRTPGRFGFGTMLGLAALVALGSDAWFNRHRRAALPIAAALTLLIVADYLVVWPLPMQPATPPPTVQAWATDPAPGAVLNVPMSSGPEGRHALYEQSWHHRPIVGGFVTREIPGTRPVRQFITGLADPALPPLVPPAGDDTRLAALRTIGIRYVNFNPAFLPDPAAYLGLARELFGEPIYADDQRVIFEVPAGDREIEAPILIPWEWTEPRRWGESWGQWTRNSGQVTIYSARPRTGYFAFSAAPFQTLRRFTVAFNGQAIARYDLGDWVDLVTPGVTLPAGFSTLEFLPEQPDTPYLGDPRCLAGTTASGSFLTPLDCDWRETGVVGRNIMVQSLTFKPGPSPDAPVPLATFGAHIQLLDVRQQFTETDGGTQLHLTFFWRTNRRIRPNHTVFIHVLDEDDNLLTSLDSEPANATHPTSAWTPGVTVIYRASLPLPPDTPPGHYRVNVGLYTWPSLERLPVSTSLPGAEFSLAQVSAFAVPP